SLLCSAGPEDSNCCSSDDECAPGGACVVTYGVCNGGDFDGYPCDCPGGTCVGSTCQGGPYDGESCTATEGSGNCSAGITCAGTSHICLAGDYKAYPCLRNSNCTNDNGTPETCGSTGLFCDGGDFDGSSCVDAADCTGTGSNGCVAPAP
ncbi:MAG TPA: hypothetical protein VMT89_19300, partial [Candidatus Acidoferrales bacterium]|nr:hypothetical protein [Candidatus Acidoferrales bacterium]